MSLELQIQQDIKAAMIAKDKVALAATRAVKAEILLAKSSGDNHELTDADVLKIVQKLIKQRRDSAAIYSEQNRKDLADNELAEISELEKYMPKQLSDGELTDEIKKIITQVGASSPADMGKVMGIANKSLAGRAEGRAIAMKVKELLS